MRTLLLCVIFLQASLFQRASSLSGGAPSQACSTLSPDPTAHCAQPQTSTVPYNIDLDQFCSDGTYSYTIPGKVTPVSFSHAKLCESCINRKGDEATIQIAKNIIQLYVHKNTMTQIYALAVFLLHYSERTR